MVNAIEGEVARQKMQHLTLPLGLRPILSTWSGTGCSSAR